MPMAWPMASPGCRRLSLGFSAAVPASVWDINSISGHCFFGGHSEFSTHSSIPVATPSPPIFDDNSTTVTTVKVFGSSDVLFCLLVYYNVGSCLHLSDVWFYCHFRELTKRTYLGYP